MKCLICKKKRKDLLDFEGVYSIWKTCLKCWYSLTDSEHLYMTTHVDLPDSFLNRKIKESIEAWK